MPAGVLQAVHWTEHEQSLELPVHVLESSELGNQVAVLGRGIKQTTLFALPVKAASSRKVKPRMEAVPASVDSMVHWFCADANLAFILHSSPGFCFHLSKHL